MMRFMCVFALAMCMSGVARGQKKTAEARTSARGILPMRIDLALTTGFVRVSDATSTSTAGGETDTAAGMLGYGLDASVRPWRSLVVAADYVRGSTSVDIDSPLVTPQSTDATWWRLNVIAGWEIPISKGPLRSITPGGGYSRERLASESQRPTQMTPSWTHSDLRLGSSARLAFMGDKLAVNAGLYIVPLMGILEEFQSNGDSPSGMGLDAAVRADYDLGGVLGRWGSLRVGGQLGWGGRWLSYDGQGDRLAGDFATRVQDVKEMFGRLDAMLVFTWRLGSGPAGRVLDS